MELLRNLFEGYPNLWGGGVGNKGTQCAKQCSNKHGKNFPQSY